MKTIIEITQGQLFIYEQSEKMFKKTGNSKRKQTVTSADLANDCSIDVDEDTNFFLAIDGPVHSGKKKVKSKIVMSNDLKNGQVIKIAGRGKSFKLPDYIGQIFTKKKDRLVNAHYELADIYPCELVSSK